MQQPLNFIISCYNKAMLYTVATHENGWTLRKWARYHLTHLSFSVLALLARKKQIKIGSKHATLSSTLRTNDTIYIHDSLQREVEEKQFQRSLIQEMIVFENDDYTIIEKPYNVTSQGEANSIADISNGYIVQRLDKTTSGLMIVAKNKLTASFFSELFRMNKVKKNYVAICKKLYDDPICKEGTWSDSIDGKDAHTYYKVVQEKGDELLVRFTPETGRKHQIRIHCAKHGIPIIGDLIYGKIQAERLYLHSESIEFEMPATACKKNGKIHKFTSNNGFNL